MLVRRQSNWVISLEKQKSRGPKAGRSCWCWLDKGIICSSGPRLDVPYGPLATFIATQFIMVLSLLPIYLWDFHPIPEVFFGQGGLEDVAGR